VPIIKPVRDKKHKNNTNTQNGTLNKQNKNNIARKKGIQMN
jgi:hypothetical protein